MFRQYGPLVGCVVLLTAVGTAHRWTRASRMDRAQFYTPLAEALSELPVKLGPWTMTEDLPLQADVLQTAGVDRFLHREYVDRANGKRVLLYVGYWGRENRGMGHGPDVCYPAVGWAAESTSEEKTIHLTDARPEQPIRLALYRFSRSDLNGIDRRVVGFTTATAGRFQPSSRAMWHRPANLDSTGEHYLAHVQVYAPVRAEAWDRAEADVLSFMELALPKLADCFPQHTNKE